MEKTLSKPAAVNAKDLSAGRIVLLVFPSDDGWQEKVHPALVLDADEKTVYVAYGTSSGVEQLSRRPTSVSVVDAEDMATASLHRQTVFRLDKRARVSISKVTRCLGRLPQHKYQQLHRAVVAAGLLRG